MASGLNLHGVSVGLRIEFNDSDRPIDLDPAMLDASQRANSAASSLPELPPTRGIALTPHSLHVTPLSDALVHITHSPPHHHFNFPPLPIPQPVEIAMEEEILPVEVVGDSKRQECPGSNAAG